MIKLLFSLIPSLSECLLSILVTKLSKRLSFLSFKFSEDENDRNYKLLVFETMNLCELTSIWINLVKEFFLCSSNKTSIISWNAIPL